MTIDQKRSIEVTARLRDIGRGLHARVKDFFENTPGLEATPLELLQATLDELERKVQPAGRGRRVFPYDRVVVRIAQPDADAAAIETVFRQLEPRLRDRLTELQCDGPETIVTEVAVIHPSGDPAQQLLTIECLHDRSAIPVTAAQAGGNRGCPTVTIAVLKGQCSEPQYVFEEPVIAIGRTAEPTDALGQVRVNHVAFLQVRDGVNETVGRAHARLQFESASGHYHLFNEGSSNPTSIIRNGRTTRVPPRDPRGVRVQSGDQVQLGRAVLRVTIGE